MLMLSVPFRLPAQAIPERIIEIISEGSISEGESGTEDILVLDDLNHFLNHPVNINNTSREELERLHFLSFFQIHSLLEYIETHGTLNSVYEIAYVRGFDRELAEWLDPFIFYGPPSPSAGKSFSAALKRPRQSLTFRYQEVAGRRAVYESYRADTSGRASPPLGDPSRVYGRYEFTAGDWIRMGWTGEKDPGEPFLRPPNRVLPDHFSWHLQVNTPGFVRQLNLGDYHLMLGQGLTSWTGFSTGKSPEAVLIRKRASGIRSYHSTEENRYFRGAAVEAGRGPWNLILLFSGHRKDALIPDTIEAGEGFTSFQTSGIHATRLQLQKKDAIKELAAGASLNYRHRRFRMGANILSLHWDQPILPASGPRHLYSSTGNRHVNASADYLFSSGRLLVFGETAINHNGSHAHLHGLEWQCVDRLNLVALFRHFTPSYSAPYARPFAEAGNASNETGYYTGFHYQPAPGWTFSGSHDTYWFPWLRYGSNAPSTGHETMFQAERQTDGGIGISLRYRSETKQADKAPTERYISLPANKEKHALRFHLTYKPLSALSLANRLEWAWYRQESENFCQGFIAYQDIGFAPSGRPFSGWFRFAVFDTDNYDTRIYAYEHDLLSVFSIPAYYGKGTRYYIVLKSSLLKKVDACIKWSVTSFADRETIGSGWDQIRSNRKQEIKAQVRVRI